MHIALHRASFNRLCYQSLEGQLDLRTRSERLSSVIVDAPVYIATYMLLRKTCCRIHSC